MIYTDMIHVVADTLTELHEFAGKVGLELFTGLKAGKPNYKILTPEMLDRVLQAGAHWTLGEELLKIAQKSNTNENTKQLLCRRQ